MHLNTFIYYVHVWLYIYLAYKLTVALDDNREGNRSEVSQLKLAERECCNHWAQIKRSQGHLLDGGCLFLFLFCLFLQVAPYVRQIIVKKKKKRIVIEYDRYKCANVQH